MAYFFLTLLHSSPLKTRLLMLACFVFCLDPAVKARVEAREARKQYVINKVKEIKECKDPELKKKLQKELDLFDSRRLLETSRGSFSGSN